jgi:hypothetical protein
VKTETTYTSQHSYSLKLYQILVMTQTQIAPLSVTIINPSLPQEQEQQEVTMMMMVSPTSTTTPSPQHAAAAGVVGCAGCVVSPTASSPSSSSPSPVAAPPTSLSPAVMRYLHDDRSEVSSLRCGSVPVNPNYDPAKDPFYTTQQFVVPSEIDIPSHKAKTIEIPVPEVVEQEGEESSLSPPDWLQLPDMKQRNNNKKKPKNKKDKGDGEQKEKQPTRSSKRRISIIGRGGGIRRRSFSEEGHDNIHVQRPTISQQQQQQQQQEDDELHRTYSEESPAAVARKQQQQQQQQRKDVVVGLVQPATPHPRHRHTRSSPSSFFTMKKIVIAKNGRPVNAKETKLRQQQHYDSDNHLKKVEQQLSPTAVGASIAVVTTCAVGTNEAQQQTKTIPLDFSNFVHPSYGSSNNKGRLLAVETSGSFTDSNQTTPTTQSSSSVGDGVVVMALPLMEPLEEIPEKKTTTKKKKTAKKQNVVASSTNMNDGKGNSRPSPRKGMVRREFQRRFLWFTNHRKSKKEELQKLCSTMV